MALQAAYEQFLVTPNPVFLSSEKASFTYVPTLTTVKETEPILKHLDSQNKTIVRTKGQKVISAIESHDALAVEVETTLEFISGGGAYLPGLDNFVVDKVAIFPTTHIIVFDDQRKIKQIRISWDQGALLKQVGVIGASGRNWPISDGKDQIRLVAGASVGTVLDTTVDRGRERGQVDVVERSVSPGKKHIVDPYSSLAATGFAPPSDQAPEAIASPVPKGTSSKPPLRDLSELFVGGDDGEGSQGARPQSPVKEIQTPAPKGAGQHKYQASRLFDVDPVVETPSVKTDSRKYSHFELGNGDEDVSEPQKQAQTTKPIPMRPNTRHLSQWDFGDFSTPAKVPPKIRGQDVRHYGWSDDEGELATSPGKNPHIARARPDAETHWAMRDEASPATDKNRPVSSHRNANLGLYQNNIATGGDDTNEPVSKRPLSTVTNINSRNKDFGASWAMDDQNPDTAVNENTRAARSQSQMKHVKLMDASWGNYDQSPEQTKAENQKPVQQRKRGQDERHWGFGDDENIVEEKKSNSRNTSAAGGSKSFWDF